MHGNVSYYVLRMKLTMVKYKTAEFLLLSMQLIFINLLSIGLHYRITTTKVAHKNSCFLLRVNINALHGQSFMLCFKLYITVN